MTLTCKKTFFFVVFLLSSFIATSNTIYQNNFTNPTPGPYPNPFVNTPNILDPNLSNSQWTISSGGWTSYTVGANNYALATSDATGETNTLDLSFDVQPGQTLTISGFSFDNKSTYGGYDTWDFYINNIDMASGPIVADAQDVSNPLQNTGSITFESPLTNLTGTVHAKVILSGGAHSSSGVFAIQNFSIIGNWQITQSGNTIPNNPIPPIASGLPIPGAFDVSSLGAAAYSIPIKVPTGFNGVQPNLSLNYNSQAVTE